jgi:hypothetical protein
LPSVPPGLDSYSLPTSRFVRLLLSVAQGVVFRAFFLVLEDAPTAPGFLLVFAALTAPLAHPSSGFGLSISETGMWEVGAILSILKIT